jgi:hypothetical protein
MSSQFTIHRLVCSTPPGLEEERDLFLAAIATFAERVTMPEWVLLAPASFRDGFNADLLQAAIKDNIKYSTFFLGIFGQDPVDPVFKRLVEYAVECAENPERPMRRVTVLFKDAGDVSPQVNREMQTLRARLTPICEVRVFSGPGALPAIFEEVLTEWYALVRPAK